MELPSISIIIATLNAERTLENCLVSIRTQKYPKDKIEIVLVDGGSVDKTISIANKYKCKIIVKKGFGSESAKAIGLRRAKGEIIGDFGSDNIIPDTKWLHHLIKPLTQNVNIIGSYPLWYTYREQDTVFNRYVSLFGVNDPVPFYLEKADRQSLLYTGYSLQGEAKRKKGYFEVEFAPDNLPTVGANGFFIRKDMLLKAKIDPKHYFHIDVVYDLVKMGNNLFAVVDTGIIHDTADTLFSLVRKRRRYMKLLYLNNKSMRRYHIVDMANRQDRLKLGRYILYSLTVIQPLWLSMRGYTKKQDIAWFVHPVFCFLITIVYAEAFIRHHVARNT